MHWWGLPPKASSFWQIILLWPQPGIFWSQTHFNWGCYVSDIRTSYTETTADVWFKPQSSAQDQCHQSCVLPVFIGNTALSCLPLKSQVLQILFLSSSALIWGFRFQVKILCHSRAWFSELPLTLLASALTWYISKEDIGNIGCLLMN